MIKQHRDFFLMSQPCPFDELDNAAPAGQCRTMAHWKEERHKKGRGFRPQKGTQVLTGPCLGNPATNSGHSSAVCTVTVVFCFVGGTVINAYQNRYQARCFQIRGEKRSELPPPDPSHFYSGCSLCPCSAATLPGLTVPRPQDLAVAANRTSGMQDTSSIIRKIIKSLETGSGCGRQAVSLRGEPHTWTPSFCPYPNLTTLSLMHHLPWATIGVGVCRR